jgi:1-acyl-sn-glycerol-3-phosphate acyltransferase
MADPADPVALKDAKPRIDFDIGNIDPDRPTRFWKTCWMVARFVAIVFFDLKTYGAKHVPRTGGALLLTNHQSYLDPVMFGVNLPRSLSYLAKSELFRNPVFRWLISNLHAFPVRQGRGDKAAIEETIRRLREGHLLNVYPEGSRTENGEIGPIQRGVALVLKRASVPIVPAVIDGSFQAWPKGEQIFRSRPVRVLYGKPILVEGLKGDQIVELVDRTLRKMLADLRAGRIQPYLT